MPLSTAWHLILPSQALGAGDRLVATRVLGQDLVAWRSGTGVVQVWRDRCPHRGVRLSLGRIIDGRLSCAYHGWEFAADTGRCERIPALADLAEVPGRVAAHVCTAAENRQMVWVRLDADADRPASALPKTLSADDDTCDFLRSLGVYASIGTMHDTLLARGFVAESAEEPTTWHGSLAGQAVVLFTHPAQQDLTFVHAWSCRPAAAQAPAAVFAALRRMRNDAETLAPDGHNHAP